MELNRRYYRFVELKVTEKKIRFSGGLTEYFPPNPQLVKKCFALRHAACFCMYQSLRKMIYRQWWTQILNGRKKLEKVPV